MHTSHTATYHLRCGWMDISLVPCTFLSFSSQEVFLAFSLIKTRIFLYCIQHFFNLTWYRHCRMTGDMSHWNVSVFVGLVANTSMFIAIFKLHSTWLYLLVCCKPRGGMRCSGLILKDSKLVYILEVVFKNVRIVL